MDVADSWFRVTGLAWDIGILTMLTLINFGLFFFLFKFLPAHSILILYKYLYFLCVCVNACICEMFTAQQGKILGDQSLIL